jgi:hypothetical protein
LETETIRGYDGTLGALEGRSATLQQSVIVQERLLAQVRAQLAAARERLYELRLRSAQAQRVLAAELLAEYETRPPSIVGVVASAHGFDDLLSRVRNLRAIERGNVAATLAVQRERALTASEARRLALIEARRQRVAAAVVVERDQCGFPDDPHTRGLASDTPGVERAGGDPRKLLPHPPVRWGG